MENHFNKIYNASQHFGEPKPASAKGYGEVKPKEPSAEETKSVPTRRGRGFSASDAAFGKKPNTASEEEKKIKEAVANVLAEAGVKEEETEKVEKEEKKETPTTGTIEVIGTGQDEIGRELKMGEVIVVRGDAGDFTGDSMEGGEIAVEGNAGYCTGNSMQGGEITIKGNAGDSTGFSMNDGKITVEGNAGACTGNSMHGGEITIKGNAGDLTGVHMKGGTLVLQKEVESFAYSAFTPQNLGTIIWKGKTIWQNGDWGKGVGFMEKMKIKLKTK